MPSQPTRVWPPTPGPWHVVPESEALHRWVVANYKGDSVASCQPAGPWITDKEADANVKLIAAAPAMLAALREVIDNLTDGNSVYELPRATMDQIRMAIADAEMAAS